MTLKIENLSSWTMTDPNSRRTISPNNTLTVVQQYRTDSGGRVYKAVNWPGDFSLDFDMTYTGANRSWYSAVSFGYPLVLGTAYTSVTDVPFGMLTVYYSSAYRIQVKSGFESWSLSQKKYCRVRRVGTTVYFERWSNAARTADLEQDSWSDSPVTTINYIILSQDFAGGESGPWSSYVIENVAYEPIGGGAIIY